MINKPFVTATSHFEAKQMASIIFPGLFLILCNYCPSSTNFYSASLILLITHSGFTFLLHILLFNSTNITVSHPCSICYYTTLFLICLCVMDNFAPVIFHYFDLFLCCVTTFSIFCQHYSLFVTNERLFSNE